jgi:hypothetical protein
MDVLLLDCGFPDASRRAYKKPTSTEYVSFLHLRGRNPSFFNYPPALLAHSAAEICVTPQVSVSC